jgi:predicted acylesterase/phospholipase RssA
MSAAQPGARPPKVPFEILTTDEILRAERDALHLPQPIATPHGSALCLSGGGIRSAAFCLGVIQAFAARQMLSQFHYLSTVSGGGYIGAWLTRCIVAAKGDVEAAEDRLNAFSKPPEKKEKMPDELRRTYAAEPKQINRLRRYTNYLTPKPGLAAADTWASVVLVGRNILVNWAVFGPLLLAAAAVPVCYAALIAGLGSLHGWKPAVLIYLAIGLLGARAHYGSAYHICIGLPSHVARNTSREMAERRFGWNSKMVNRRIMAPALLWLFLLPVACAAVSQLQFEHTGGESGIRHVFLRAGAPAAARPAQPAAGPGCVAIPAVTTGSATVCPPPSPLKHNTLFALLPLLGLVVSGLAYERARRTAAHDRKTFDDNRLAWWIAAVLAAMCLWLGAILAQNHDPLWLAIAGPAWVLAAESLRIIVYVAIRKGGVYGDLDREWLARISGSKIRTVLGFTFLAIAAVLLPVLVIDNLPSTWTTLTLAAGFLSGPLAALGGMSALTSFLPGGKPAKGDGGKLSGLPLNWIIAAIAIGFGFLLMMLLGRLAEIIATWPLRGPCPVPHAAPVEALLAFMVFTALVFAPWLGGCAYRRQILWLDTEGWIGRFCLAALLTAAAGIYQWRHVDMLQRAIAVLAGRPIPDPAIGGCVTAFIAAAVAAFAVTGAVGIATIVNLNHFSLHAVYRNRLMRAFLGSARDGGPATDRLPDAYTDFDPMDNFRMADTFPLEDDREATKDDAERGHARTKKRLFPVINVTLNRTSGKDTARAERMGAPFTITPLHCGAANLRKDAKQPPAGAFVRTAQYAGGREKDRGRNDARNGISLGTAMTISGAAVSPNMGYNSSPFTAFLMTLFNVRLGAWLPNPGRKNTRNGAKPAELMRQSGPKNAIPTMLQELTGQSDDTGDYVYLSDGGHFDNLGLYEMLRRRCKYIVVVDAGADPENACFDLGHALEIARIDMGVQVEFITPVTLGESKLSEHGAFADIFYPPEADGGESSEGSLIYLKPWLPAGLPVDLQAYKKTNDKFPNTPTPDQFFTESDFEAYRHLGEYLTNVMLRTPQKTIETVFGTLRDYAVIVKNQAAKPQG